MENEDVVETPEQEIPAAEPSLRETLEASFAEAEKPEAPSAEDKAVTEAPAAETPVKDAATPPVQETPPTDTIPQRLQAKWADKWNTLSPEVKSEFLQYESHIGRVVAKYGREANAWNRVEQVMAPYSEMIRSEGGDFHGVIGGMLETARLLRQGTPDQKLGLLYYLVDRFQIPVNRGEDGSTSLIPPTTPPEVLNRLSALEHRDLTARAAADYNVRQEVSTELDTFLADPAFTYAKEPGYLDLMADLIRAGRAKDLPDAYGKAAWLHERTQPLEIAKANQAAIAPRLQQAARARGAAVSVNGNAPGLTRTDASKMSLRETLEAAFEGDLD